MSKLGIHPFGHDSSVVFIDHKNKNIQALSLERVTRFKHDYRFVEPLLGDFFTLDKNTKIIFAMKDVSPSRIAHFDKIYQADINFNEYKKLLRSNSNNIIKAIRIGFKSPKKLLEMVLYRKYLNSFVFKRDIEGFSEFISRKLGVSKKNISFYDHHFSHACSAYYFAPLVFENNCLVVTLDGQGDGVFSKVFSVKNNILCEEVVSFDDASIPLLYSIATYTLGFASLGDEGKLEALACYANSNKKFELTDIFEEAFKIESSLGIKLKVTRRFPFYSVARQWQAIRKYLDMHKSKMENEDFAMIIQSFFENFFLQYIKLLKDKFGVKKMAFAGGAFANVKLNLRLLEESGLEEIFIFPVMGDDGSPLGAVAYDDYVNGVDISWLRDVRMPYFGPAYSSREILSILERNNSKIKFKYIGKDFYKILAQKIAEKKICGLFQGRMEFGPRALGHRSILSTPLDRNIRDMINLKFKKREWFQPFCPSILEIERGRLLEKTYNNKHMTCAFRVKKEFLKELEGIVHVDGTARAQFVEKEDDECFFNLLTELKKIIGFGVVLNTSFNIHGKAIVMTAQDALDDFFSCGIDYLFIEEYIVERKL